MIVVMRLVCVCLITVFFLGTSVQYGVHGSMPMEGMTHHIMDTEMSGCVGCDAVTDSSDAACSDACDAVQVAYIPTEVTIPQRFSGHPVQTVEQDQKGRTGPPDPFPPRSTDML